MLNVCLNSDVVSEEEVEEMACELHLKGLNKCCQVKDSKERSMLYVHSQPSAVGM